jgi:hypothetical protein
VLDALREWPLHEGVGTMTAIGSVFTQLVVTHWPVETDMKRPAAHAE